MLVSLRPKSNQLAPKSNEASEREKTALLKFAGLPR